MEIKDVKLPLQLQRAMAAEAEASREARAKVRWFKAGDPIKSHNVPTNLHVRTKASTYIYTEDILLRAISGL